MVSRILETDGAKEEAPHFKVYILEEVDYRRVSNAYDVLSKSYNGVGDFISVLEMIAEGWFNVTEVVVAALLLVEAMEGDYYDSTGKCFKAKWLKINYWNYLYLIEQGELISDLEEGLFFEEDETVHRIHPNIER